MGKLKAITTIALLALIGFSPITFAKHPAEVSDGISSGFFNKLMFMMMDSNHDKKLSKDEYMKMVEMEWTMMDKKNKGEISPQDFSDGAKDVFFQPKMFKMMDSDKNKMVNKSEFMKMMDHKFDMMDKNKDGTLSMEEWLGVSQSKSDG